ncbi:hypothetical protein ACJ72_06481 [Emergomyces africanus]|uniref:Rhodopsin domain-containing protein n=1 Tax=Emergomyces africanus TaxID=1955775 RepID=A0A1B7NQX1_9EURO|nr:hypothetical protein ACJ72_06481 [Emergomyces africanus]
MSELLGQAPPGIDLTENRNREFNASIATVYGLAVLAVGLRFFTRFKVQSFAIKVDDWLILVSLLSVTCSFALAIVGGDYGLGKHVWIVPLTKTQITDSIWRPLEASLHIHVHVYSQRSTNKVFHPGILSSHFRDELDDIQDSKAGRCLFEPHVFYLGNAAANVLTDVLILLVPIPLVWKLQMPTGKKVLLTPFVAAYSVCVVSFVRIKFMGDLAKAKDVTFILTNIFLWSFVEPCIGIVCACLPTLRPLFQHVTRVVFGTEFGRSISTGPGISPGLVRTQQTSTAEGSKLQKMGFKRMKGTVGGDEPRSANGRILLRPADDETMLTTVSAHYEMEDFRRNGNGTSDADSENQTQPTPPMGIRVKTDFDWQENVH